MEYLYKVELDRYFREIQIIRRKILRETEKMVFIDEDINYSRHIHKKDIGLSVFDTPEKALAAHVKLCKNRLDRANVEYIRASNAVAEAEEFMNKELAKSYNGTTQETFMEGKNNGT